MPPSVTNQSAKILSMNSQSNVFFLKKALVFWVFIMSMPCLGQKGNVILINRSSEGQSFFSYWPSLSTIPRNNRELRKIKPRVSERAIDIFEIPAEGPLLFNFSADFRIQFVWLFPGDTLEFFRTDSDLMPFQFDGSRPYKELMFYSMMESSNLGFLVGNHKLEITTTFNFNKIAEETFNRYQLRLKLLKDCMASEKFSDRGAKVIAKSLYYQYLGELLFPYQVWKPISETVKNNTLVPESYKIKLRGLAKELNQDSLVYLLDYRRFVVQYARFLMIEESIDKKIDFSTLLAFYQRKFSGQIRDCLLFDEIYLNYLRSKRVSEINDVFDSIENDSLKNILLSIQKMSKTKFSEQALETELETPFGEKHSLRQVLSMNSGKSIYIDFWATWCAPCLMEMPKSKELVQEFKNDSTVFLYMSIDIDKKKWIEKINNLPGDKNVNHYYLGEGTNFAKEMGILSIPRYFLVGKTGQIISSDAPRPQSKEIRELISLSLK